MRRVLISVVAVLIAVGMVGCKGSLSRSKAEALLIEKLKTHRHQPDILEGVGKFDDTKNHPQMTEEGADCAFDYDNGVPQDYTLLQQLGYLDVKTTGPKSYLVTMTDKGTKFLSAANSPLFAHAKYGECETDLASLPVAEAEFDKVTGITDGDSVRKVEFHLKWVLTPLGTELLADNSPLWKMPSRNIAGLTGFVDMSGDPATVRRLVEQGIDSSAQFQKYDDGWRIKE
jgi:hypothetical protein